MELLCLESKGIMCQPVHAHAQMYPSITLTSLGVFGPDESDEAEPINIAVLNSFEIFHALHHQGHEQFQLSLIGDGGDDGLADFWKEALKEKWAYEHPVVQRNLSKLDKLFPVTYHMDGAEVQRNNERYFLCVGSPIVQFAQTNNLDAKFCLASISHVLMKVPGAMHRIMHELARWLDWCHHVAEQGTLPYTGFYGEHFSKQTPRGQHAGQSIMGDYLGIYAGTKSDGKARVP